ncbi:MAG: DUF4435 domain-containing protein [Campylobacteraceae bacterium]|nr:DUF4435 domain-containing protein [Campylobacteraceae bacterium]
MSSCNLLNEMKESAESGHVAYANFARAYSKTNPNIVYCFFEGDEDKKYYGTRITIKYEREFQDFTCEGRDLVLKAKELIKNRKEYNKAKALFFIDKDYTDDTVENELYVTPCYSIENFYSTEETLKKILQNEFNMNESDENFIKIVKLHTKSLDSYHNKLLFLNAWLSCQHDIRISTKLSTRLNINEVLKKYFKIDENMFDINLNLKLNIFDDLENQEILENTLFTNAPKVTTDMIDSKIAYFNKIDKSCIFRGKFELKFFIDFLKRLKEEATSKHQKILTKKYKCALSFKLEDSISVLAQYSNTPTCLFQFLDKHLKVA